MLLPLLSHIEMTGQCKKVTQEGNKIPLPHTQITPPERVEEVAGSKRFLRRSGATVTEPPPPARCE
jgi:hypothetical protein